MTDTPGTEDPAHVFPPFVDMAMWNRLPLSVDVDHPTSDDPPLLKRPDWNVPTMVEPNEKVSGSTWVRWKLVVFVKGSLLTLITLTFASAGWVKASTRATTAPAAIAGPTGRAVRFP